MLPYPPDMPKAVRGYGIGAGLLIAVLKLVEDRFLVVEHSIEIYGGLIALLFAASSSRRGLRTSTPPTRSSTPERRAPARRWWKKPREGCRRSKKCTTVRLRISP
jgi:hypothetical protein